MSAPSTRTKRDGLAKVRAYLLADQHARANARYMVDLVERLGEECGWNEVGQMVFREMVIELLQRYRKGDKINLRYENGRAKRIYREMREEIKHEADE